MANRHRRRKWVTESKKNASNASIAVTIVSVVAILFLLVSVIYAIESGGRIPNYMGALGMVFFLATIPCVVIGRKQFKMQNYNFVSRIFGMVVPIIALIGWAILYFFGLVFA